MCVRYSHIRNTHHREILACVLRTRPSCPYPAPLSTSAPPTPPLTYLHSPPARPAAPPRGPPRSTLPHPAPPHPTSPFPTPLRPIPPRPALLRPAPDSPPPSPSLSLSCACPAGRSPGSPGCSSPGPGPDPPGGFELGSDTSVALYGAHRVDCKQTKHKTPH